MQATNKAERVARMRDALHEACAALPRRLQIMEVCGTHTVSIFRSGLRSLLPESLRLVSGPGCPVCVTAQRHIDAAIELASKTGAIICTYGDMLRVPGRLGSLEKLRAAGADIRVVNSTMSAVDVARRNPQREVAFLAVGFETTAPATAVALLNAKRSGCRNFSALTSHKLVVPAMLALLSSGDVPLDGFVGPGHVSVILGSNAYEPVVQQYEKPIVIAGFEAEQIMTALLMLVAQIRDGRAEIENAYPCAVRPEGNPTALGYIDRVFEPVDTAWRALGVIPSSGLGLRAEFSQFDAVERFGITIGEDEDNPACRCGEVITGKAEPADCPLFGRGCDPLHPIGPCMVSSEGTCSAWYRYNRHAVVNRPTQGQPQTAETPR